MKCIFSKSYALILLLITAWNIANAQTKIGVRAGINFSNVKVEDENGGRGETRPMPGIRLGLTADLPVTNNFFIQPGIMYAPKGFKQKTGGYYGLAANFEVKVSYVEFPVSFLYKPSLTTGKLLLGAGPYVGYGTRGTWKSGNVIVIGDIITDSKGETIFRNDYADGEFGNYLYGKPWDYGANFLAGYEIFDRMSVQINAQVGLANLQPKSAGEKRDGSLRNKGFGFSIGYEF